RLPSPSSLRLVTFTTFPPRPPVVNFPNPSAPGKAIGAGSWAMLFVDAQLLNSIPDIVKDNIWLNICPFFIRVCWLVILVIRNVFYQTINVHFDVIIGRT